MEARFITYGLKDDYGQVVKAVVPAQLRTDIQRQSTDATVPATLSSVDGVPNRAQVVTTPSARCSDALPHAGVAWMLLWNMVAHGDMRAEAMPCAKDDGTHGILAQDAHGNPAAVLVSAGKAIVPHTCQGATERSCPARHHALWSWGTA